MPSIFQRFKALLPTYPLSVATVIETDGSTSTVSLPGGQQVLVRGTSAVGTTVFVQDGVIQSEAPDLPLHSAEI